MNEYDNNNNYGDYNGYTQTQSPEPQHKKQKKGMRAGSVIALCLICSILAAALGAGGAYLFMRGGNDDALVEGELGEIVPPDEEKMPAPPVEPEETPPATDVLPAAAVGSVIYELACQQVVGITTEITYTNFFGQISASSVSGSGFIISEDGYIMTNNHVIENARKGGYEITVLLHDGSEYIADLVGYDADNDIAVLKIDAEGLSAAQLGDSDALAVGQEIFAVGNPLGELNYTMTTGIVSATDRAITTSDGELPINMFQIDAAVNSGNSGGPVYNTEGQVIGVVTAKTSATGVEGLGFAIPINDASHISNQLMEYGYVTDRATLGISAETIPSAVAERYNMVEGAYVRSVTEGSPAEEAGIEENDIITAVDGQEVVGSTELTSIVRSYAVGDTATITVWRSGETVDLTVTFGESQKPVEPTPAPQQEQGQYQYGYGDMEDFFRRFFGGFGF